MLASEFFTTTYAPLKLRGRSPNTSRLYRATFAACRRALGRELLLKDLADDLVIARMLTTMATVKSLRTGRVLSPYTREKIRTQIVALASFARDRGLLTGPKLFVPQEPLPERTPEAWTAEEIQRIFDAASVHPGRIGALKVCNVFPLLIAVLYETGERITAILDTTMDDYHRPHLVVRAENRKGRRRDKMSLLTDATCDLVESTPRTTNHIVDVPPSQRSRLWPTFGAITAAAGLAGGRESKFHRIRKSTASLYCALGHDPVALMGHSSMRITRAYLAPRITGGPPAAAAVLPPLARRQKMPDA